MKRKEILEEFHAQWASLKDNIVGITEFEDYYKDLSATIDRDDNFEITLRNSWKLPEPKKKVEEKKVVIVAKETFEDVQKKFFDNA